MLSKSVRVSISERKQWMAFLSAQNLDYDDDSDYVLLLRTPYFGR